MAEKDLNKEEVGQLLVCLVAKLHTQIPPNLWNLDGGGFFFVANLSRRLPSWTAFVFEKENPFSPALLAEKGQRHEVGEDLLFKRDDRSKHLYSHHTLLLLFSCYYHHCRCCRCIESDSRKVKMK
jgi:hypothetical protein